MAGSNHTTSSSSAAATTAWSTPPIWQARARKCWCSNAATCSAARPARKKIVPGFKFSVCSYVVSLLRPGNYSRPRSSAPRPGNSSARRHVHAHAERRLSVARERSRQDAPRNRAPLARRRRGLRRIRQGDAGDVPLREADSEHGAAGPHDAESARTDEAALHRHGASRACRATTSTTRSSS